MNTFAELNKIREERVQKAAANKNLRVVVGLATCGNAAGAKPIFETIKAELAKAGSPVEVGQVGCIGLCKLEPIVEVIAPDGQKTTYVLVKTPEMAQRIVKEHILGGKVVTDLLIKEHGKPVTSVNDTAFLKNQYRIALRNCGVIDPESIEQYLARDGYKAYEKVLAMPRQEVINIIKESGLRGRGGGGFSTGLKWQFAHDAVNDVKYVCCNADEGDPGAFMDRSVLEGDPHAVIEAMMIAGYAIGAEQGYIYVRAEYPLAIERLNIAIAQAKELGILGQNIMGTGKNFELGLRLGAGAFVCGEETALIASIEGKRGEPRPRPPFPAVKGLFGKPTLLNNVETYANIPQIILNGSEWLRKIGTEKSKGTKVFALGGKIDTAGLVEIPMGTTLREVIYNVGGGIPGGKRFKAAQTGGPSGGCITEENLDIQIDYDNLVAIGSMMGSGGLIVMDEDNCMVDIAKFFLIFTVDESCGKCTPCRIGNKRLLELLDKITDGKGEEKDLVELEELSEYIKANSLCGLGQTAPNPVLSTFHYFKEEYFEHVREKKCRAGICKNLLQFVINDKCKGCTACARKCPVGAISGEKMKPHTIDTAKCIKCGQCLSTCKFGAIEKR